jgi:hypothetical protein
VHPCSSSKQALRRLPAHFAVTGARDRLLCRACRFLHRGFLAILFMSWRHRLAPMRGASICCAAGLRIMVQLTDPQFSASAPIYQAIRISATPRALRARYRFRGIDRRSRAEVSTARPHSRHQPRTVAGRRRMVTPPGFAAPAGPGGCRACGSLPETHHRWFRLYRVAEPRRFTRDERPRVRGAIPPCGHLSLSRVYVSDIDVWRTVKTAAWIRSGAGIRSP